MSGAQAKELKTRINTEWIYPRRTRSGPKRSRRRTRCVSSWRNGAHAAG
ncbi:hypothetical protein AWB83_03728 [Caballeronia ptereochthonis]|uniref:Uncharacterized protein n=1 Tax=Caballeronia ptereochthonis TaxID=1777144 RepID=A0A158BWU8_9BURK|nr:hypothetical protein AWB83_03728 [Caballeronia ptereochthonis]